MDKKNGMFYGWWIVLVTALILFIGVGSSFYTISVFLLPLQEAFGWSKTQVSVGFIIAAGVSGLLSPVIGVLISKVGTRNVEIYGAVAVGIALLALGSIQQLWHYYALMGLMATGIGAIAWVPSQTIVSHWFNKKRGFAMGLVMMGLGLGGMVMVLVASYLVTHAGWQWAYRVMGIMTLGIVLPAIVIFVKNKPEDMGLEPDGSPATSQTQQKTAELSLTVAQAVKGLPFYLILLIVLCFYIIFGGLAQHGVALLNSMNIAQAATFWGLTIGFSVPGRFLFGYMGDKISLKTLMVVIWVFSSLAMASVYYIPQNSFLVWGFVVFYGSTIGGMASVFPLLLGRTFGLEHFSKFVGLYGLLQILFMGIGTFMMGKLFDASGSYIGSVMILGIFSLLGVFSAAFLTNPNKAAAAVVVKVNVSET